MNEEKKIEYNMLTETNGKNSFIIYLFSMCYPGIIIEEKLDIEIKEKNNLIENFIKNRYNDILTKEEFADNFGADLGSEDEEINEHEHEN